VAAAVTMTWVPLLLLCTTVVGAADTVTDAHEPALVTVTAVLATASYANGLLASRTWTPI